MSPPQSRLSNLLAHFRTSGSPAAADPAEYKHNHNFHTLSPTYFLPRAAAIEPDVGTLAGLSGLTSAGFSHLSCHVQPAGHPSDVR
jgi:hypothetical protein